MVGCYSATANPLSANAIGVGCKVAYFSRDSTDYAAATSELARTQIIAQAATAILAQANQQPQSVLSLLK